MEPSDHGQHPSARILSCYFSDNIIRPAVGAAAEYDNPLRALQHQTLFMGETVRHPSVVLFQEHLFSSSCLFKPRRMVCNKPDSFIQPVISSHPDQSVPVFLQHAFPDPDIFHTALFDPVAVLPAGFLQPELCPAVSVKENRHPVCMIIMGMGKDRKIHIRQA